MLAIYSGVFSFHLVTPTHRPIHTHPLCKGFADAHRFTLKCWWVVGGVDWTIFRDSPYKSDFISVTHVRAMMCCLLILFITQFGSCTLRPPRLLLCCFPLNRRQISSDTTSSPLSSTATKTQTSKGLAWRLNKSACNSANGHSYGRFFTTGLEYVFVLYRATGKYMDNSRTHS